MLFRQFFDRESSTYTYLIADEKEGIIIDPVKNNVAQYIKLLSQLDIRLVTTLETHLHADHITGAGALQQALNCQIMMGKESNVNVACQRFSNHDVIPFGSMKLKVLYTPGHTDDSYSFLLNDRVFTGDTLFIRGTGRTDFQNGSAGSQYHSIMSKIFTLPDNTLVYPGHDYNGMTVSTIGEEKRYNPRLQVENEEAYIKLMNNLNLAYPKMIDVALPANQVCGFDLESIAGENNE